MANYYKFIIMRSKMANHCNNAFSINQNNPVALDRFESAFNSTGALQACNLKIGVK